VPKKRAAKKNREAGEADAAPVPAPAAPQPKAEAKAKPKAKAEAKPKAEPKPEAKPKDKAAEPKKAAAKKSSAAPKAEEEPKKKKSLDLNPSLVLDDGTGDAWECASGLSKKATGRLAKKTQTAAFTKEQEQRQATISAQNQNIPGMSGPLAATMMSKAGAVSAETKAALEKASAAVAQKTTPDGKPAEVKPAEKLETISVRCPDEKVGRVIGPKGANLILIKEKTGVTKIDSENGCFTATGKPEQVAIAEVALRELVEKGYTSLAYENFSDIAVMVHPGVFPDLIGPQGCIIRKMKEALKVEVTIPAVPKGAPPQKKFPVTIAGQKENAEKAKEVIEHIVQYYHHDITHPDTDHIEMQLDPSMYSYIIGTKGSELRHIQNTFKVRVYIPRDHSENWNVVIVGEKKDAERAKASMEKTIAKASEPRGRGAADKADDHWGGEDADEPWMSQYLYKRKT